MVAEAAETVDVHHRLHGHDHVLFEHCVVVLAQLASLLAPVPDAYDADRVSRPEGAPLQEARFAIDRVDYLVDVRALDAGPERPQPGVMRLDVGLEDRERVVGHVPPIEAALEDMVVAADDRVGVHADHFALLHHPMRVHDVADAAPIGAGLNPAHVDVVDLDVGEAPAELVLDRGIGRPRHLDLGHARLHGLQRGVAADLANLDALPDEGDLLLRLDQSLAHGVVGHVGELEAAERADRSSP